MEEEAIVTNSVIIERKLKQISQTEWLWSEPKTIQYSVSSNQYEIIKQLLNCTDLKTHNPLACKRSLLIKPKTEAREQDSGVSSSFSDHVSIKSEYKFNIDQIYQVPNKKRWLKAKLIRINRKGKLILQTLLYNKQITTTFDRIAFAEPPDNWFKVGSRVVALVGNISKTGEFLKGHRSHKRGVVIEIPSYINRNRYLIIFEDALTFYVKPSSVKSLVVQNDQNWDDLPTACKNLVSDFFSDSYKDKKCEIQKDLSRSYFIDENYFDIALVTKFDCSLVIYWSNALSSVLTAHKDMFPLIRKYLDDTRFK